MIKKIKERINDKKLTRPLLVAMLIVVLILGGTFAWLRIGLNGTKNNIIKAGLLDLIIDESPTDGDTVRLERAIPQSYRQGITNQPYRFTLINNSTIDTDYTISLEDLYEGADASLTENDKIADNLIRYILVKNDDEMVATNSKLLSTGRTIDAGTISGKSGNTPTEIPYTLYVWIDSKAGDDGTESDIMDKIFNARLNITAEQHKEESTDGHNVGDVVLYNPVTLEYCNNVSEENCYEWIVLNKNGNDVGELMYLRENDALISVSGPFTVLENYTGGWNSKLTVDESYDLPASTSMPAFSGYTYNKARLPIPSDLAGKVIDTIISENVALIGSENQNFIITAYNNTNFGMSGNYQNEFMNSGGPPYGVGMGSSDSSKYYIHPVINIGPSSTVVSKTCADLETDSWSEINSLVSTNLKTYPLGCEKTVNVGSYGTHKVRIANNTRPSECNGSDFSQSACGFVLEFTDIIDVHQMNPLSNPYNPSATTTAGDGNIGGWKNSEMRTVMMPAIYNLLPEDLKSIIISTKTVSGHGTDDASNIVVDDDKLYLLSNKEAGFSGSDTSLTSTRTFDFYKDNTGKTLKKYNGEAKEWWLRSAASGGNNYYYAIKTLFEENPSFFNSHTNVEYGISPAFRIG